MDESEFHIFNQRLEELEATVRELVHERDDRRNREKWEREMSRKMGQACLEQPLHGSATDGAKGE